MCGARPCSGFWRSTGCFSSKVCRIWPFSWMSGTADQSNGRLKGPQEGISHPREWTAARALSNSRKKKPKGGTGMKKGQQVPGGVKPRGCAKHRGGNMTRKTASSGSEVAARYRQDAEGQKNRKGGSESGTGADRLWRGAEGQERSPGGFTSSMEPVRAKTSEASSRAKAREGAEKPIRSPARTGCNLWRPGQPHERKPSC